VSGPFGLDPFLVRALLEIVLAATLCALVGVLVVLRRLAFFTMALTHATFPGVVLAGLFGVSLLLGGAVFGVLVVALLTVLSRRARTDDASVTGVLLAGGFAVGVLLLSSQDGFSRDLSSYLVGSIVTVRPADVAVTVVTLVVAVLVLAVTEKEMVLVAFDRAAAEASGLPVRRLDLLLLLLIEAAVVTSVPAVGTLQSVALIVAPAATARLWVSSVRAMTVLAVAIGAGSGVAGLLISRAVDVAAGGTVVLVLALLFLVSALLSGLPSVLPSVLPSALVAGQVRGESVQPS
jgi:manganese/iron transport system permease protein